MRDRVVRRALVLATVVTVGGATAVVTADSMWTGDNLAMPSEIDLGAVAPGAVLTVDVPFVMTCASSSHVNPGQAVILTWSGLEGQPPGGTITTADTTIGPPPTGWPLDGASCPSGIPPAVFIAQDVVTIVAPLADGNDYLFQTAWLRTFDPQSSGDSTALPGLIFASFRVDVVSNTPPTLILPSGLTQEGDTAGGAFAAYTFGATDTEDDPDPVAACAPAPGAFVALGTTPVSCSVTDAGGLTTTGGFNLTVVDTTAPTLANVPAGLSLTTAGDGGAILAYNLPTATDAVDPDLLVVCAPAPGALAPVGDSTVTCTATDDSLNVATASFPVHVSLATALWDSPIGGDPAWLIGNHGRTVPVKASLFVGGVVKTTGSVDLVAAQCGGGASLLATAMTWKPDSSRWFAHLDTALLPGPGCYTVTAAIDGGAGPSFTLDLRAAVEQSAPGQAKPF